MLCYQPQNFPGADTQSSDKVQIEWKSLMFSFYDHALISFLILLLLYIISSL